MQAGLPGEVLEGGARLDLSEVKAKTSLVAKIMARDSMKFANWPTAEQAEMQVGAAGCDDASQMDCRQVMGECTGEAKQMGKT